MALRIRFQGPTGSTFGYSIERLVDGLSYDFNNSTFDSSPTTLFASLPENTPNFPGQYKVTLTPTSSGQFTDGDYVVSVYDQNALVVVGLLSVVMHAGDDTTQIPGGPVASVTAAVTVGTNNDKGGYALSSAGLDSVSTAAPTGVAGTFREMVVATWRRFYKPASRSSTQIKTYADDGTTVLTTQAITADESGNETQGTGS